MLPSSFDEEHGEEAEECDELDYRVASPPGVQFLHFLERIAKDYHVGFGLKHVKLTEHQAEAPER